MPEWTKPICYFVAIMGVVIVAQATNCTTFDSDEFSRILWTAFGLLGVQATPSVVSKMRGK